MNEKISCIETFNVWRKIYVAMNVIFLTLSRIADIEERGIYSDLMRKFHGKGHLVYIRYSL